MKTREHGFPWNACNEIGDCFRRNGRKTYAERNTLESLKPKLTLIPGGRR